MKAYNTLVVFTTFLFCGCVSTMPETHYQNFSNFVGQTQKCFEAGYITPQTYAEAKNAFTYVVNTWNYDRNKMSSMMKSAYSSYYPDAQSCRQVEANAYQMISGAKQSQQAQTYTNTQAFSNPQTINCKKIGQFLNVEIKTFSGLMCPFGWEPVN